MIKNAQNNKANKSFRIKSFMLSLRKQSYIIIVLICTFYEISDFAIKITTTKFIKKNPLFL